MGAKAPRLEVLLEDVDPRADVKVGVLEGDLRARLVDPLALQVLAADDARVPDGGLEDGQLVVAKVEREDEPGRKKGPTKVRDRDPLKKPAGQSAAHLRS